MYIILFVSLIVVLILMLSWIGFIKERKKFNVRGPFPLPLLGNAHLFIVKSTAFLNLLERLWKKYGDAFTVHLLSSPYVVLNHPEYIEHIVSSSELITKGRSYGFMTPWLGQGLLTATGQRWKTHRKFLTPAFHFNVLQNFLPVFCKNGKILRDILKKHTDGTLIDIFPLIALAALDNVTESIMGVSVNAQHNKESEYVKSIEALSEILTMRMQIPIIGEDPIFNLLPYKKKQDKALDVVHGHTKNVIKTRRQDLKKLNITTVDGSNELGIKNKYAFLDMLLLGEIDGKKIDDESVKEEVDTFMFEGHDTTTSGIVYSIYCISKYMDVQKKLVEEQKHIFGDDMHRDPTYNELHQMKYLEMVIKESLRLYPSVPMIERMMTRDIDSGGLQMIKGTTCLINIYQMQRNPKVFDDPLVFRPERFETSPKNPFSWLVFSAGPRNCIGQKFAMMEMKVTISEVIRNFELSFADVEPELCADLVLRSKNGVQIKIKPRC